MMAFLDRNTQSFLNSKSGCVWRNYNDLFYSVFTYDPRIHVGRDSSVGIETRYSLDGPGIESRWGGMGGVGLAARFSASLPTGPRAHLASYTMGTGSFPGVRRSGRGVDHPLSYSAEAKERVELYFCSSYEPSWPVLRWALPLPLAL